MSKLTDTGLSGLRNAINFLIVDETEAIKGYDEVLRLECLSEAARTKLEKIRNEEIAHLVDLSDIYRELVEGAIDEHVATELFDSKRWRIHRDAAGFYYFKDETGACTAIDGEPLRFADSKTAGEFYIDNLYDSKAWGGVVPTVSFDSKMAPGLVVMVEDGFVVTARDGWYLDRNRAGGTMSVSFNDALRLKTRSEADSLSKSYLDSLGDL